MVHDLSIEHAIGPREVHVFEYAERSLSRFYPPLRFHPYGTHLHDLARLDIAHELGTHRIEPARLAGNDPPAPVGQFPQRKRPNAARIAKGIQRHRRYQHDGVRTVELLHHQPYAAADMARSARVNPDRARRDFAVGMPVQLNALVRKPSPLGSRVDQRAVMRQGN